MMVKGAIDKEKKDKNIVKPETKNIIVKDAKNKKKKKDKNIVKSETKNITVKDATNKKEKKDKNIVKIATKKIIGKNATKKKKEKDENIVKPETKDITVKDVTNEKEEINKNITKNTKIKKSSNNKDEQKKSIFEKFKIVFLIIIFAVLALAAYLLYDGFNPVLEQNPYYHYNIKRNIDYKVYLKNNDFYEEKYLGAGKQYTSALINYIDIDFGLDYSDSKKTKFEYSYNIVGTIIGEYEDTSNGKQELWTKKYQILNTQKNTQIGTQFEIKENLKIYYDQYNKVVNDFKNKFKLAIDAYLNVKMNIKYKSLSLTSERKYEDEETIEINIPLSKSTIKISTDVSDDTSDSLVEEELKYNMHNIYIGILLLVADFFLFSMIKDYLFTNDKTKYEKNLDRLLKDYREIIVETTTPINYSGLTIYDIGNFDDMVDVEEELKSPILLYEEKPGKLCYFVVIKDTNAYRYTLDVKKLK